MPDPTNIYSILERDQYPALLQAIHDPPARLWMRGVLPPPQAPSIAIIGARRPSEAGRMFARRLASDLARAGCVIVSGLALGIDGIAHEAALSVEGSTIAVLGSGVDVPYPASNHALAERIASQHNSCLVSEYPPGSRAYKTHFIARNRIVAGLSQMTIVVEGMQKSGTRLTADFALSEGRDVGAVPGSPLNPLAATPNRLIQDGAAVITCAQDVFDALQITFPEKEALEHIGKAKETSTISELQHSILSCLSKKGPQTIDSLIEETENSFENTAEAVTALEIACRITATSEGVFFLM